MISVDEKTYPINLKTEMIFKYIFSDNSIYNDKKGKTMYKVQCEDIPEVEKEGICNKYKHISC